MQYKKCNLMTTAEMSRGRPRPAPTGESPPTHETENSQRYALVSVSDKTGVVDFARVLDSLGYRIISTGGTANTLRESGLNVVPIEEVTGNPESFDGRMKTISFNVEGGILYDRKNPSHIEDAHNLHVPNIEIVVCNLYPFEQTVARGASFDEVIENIDVGGPTMVRAGGKNFKNVLVVVDPSDYERVGEALKSGGIDEDLRLELALKVFEQSSSYDGSVAQYLRKFLLERKSIKEAK